MSNNFVQSRFLRNTYFTLNKSVARSQFWRQGPRVFINSLPKSGTHLLTSLLDSTAEIKSSGRHLKTVDFDLGTAGQSFCLNVNKFQNETSKVRGRQYYSAHFPWDESFKDVLESNQLKYLNMIRDPRDMIVSRYYYIMGLKRHHLHDFLNNNFRNEEERILALINGPTSNISDKNPSFVPYRIILKWFMGWQKATCAMTIRYEDIIGPRGNTSEAHQVETISQILKHLSIIKTDSEIQDLIPKFLGIKTATLRNGRSGEWRSRLSEPACNAVTEHLNDLIHEMGYS